MSMKLLDLLMNAIERVIEEGKVRTRDLGGSATLHRI